ncbi:hypothetical protein CTAYLR_003314 [Chrysophaeum taylorii]|uniref:Uncharacterized protein n=1 Tax=Chrysophaeum taylorii TaxID=2483200 RepID=A0AAD7UHY2_9STRA|nr:hypothetical protein CTAYLR_003314 [Chrysophaeum taylorii]
MLDADLVERLLAGKEAATEYTLDARGQRLNSIAPELFQYVPRLRSLDVSWNSLSYLSIESRHLREVNAGSNQIDRVAIECPVLEVLCLHDNKLAEVKDLPKTLKQLRLDRNELSTVPRNLPSTLTTLDLSGNALGSLAGLASLSLTELDVSRNELREVSALSGSKNLVELRLADNCLQKLEGRFAALRVLCLARNQLKGHPKIPKLPRLAELDLRGNEVSSLNGLENNAPRVDVLDLGGNRLDDLATALDVLAKLPELVELHLAGNPCAPETRTASGWGLVCARKLNNLQVLDDLDKTMKPLAPRHARGLEKLEPLEDTESKAANFRAALKRARAEIRIETPDRPPKPRVLERALSFSRLDRPKPPIRSQHREKTKPEPPLPPFGVDDAIAADTASSSNDDDPTAPVDDLPSDDVATVPAADPDLEEEPATTSPQQEEEEEEPRVREETEQQYAALMRCYRAAFDESQSSKKASPRRCSAKKKRLLRILR